MTIQYSKQSYWNERYAKDRDCFDWFQHYPALKDTIKQALHGSAGGVIPKEKCRVLVPGCGTSSLSADMVKDGYGSVTSIDWSEICIENMREKDPKGSYEVMNIEDLAYEDDSFDLVIAKGVIDSIICGENSVHAVATALHEFHRVLTDNGTLICVSYGSPDQRQWHFEGKVENEFSWKVDWVTIPKPKIPNLDVTTKDDLSDHYIYICQKRAPLPAAISEETEEQVETEVGDSPRAVEYSS
eukprot:CAMPEP_0116003570 /NCGR_PEP_ID=MMETSP0321-20121206/126_1 /TAXON_ID=163516 /ORGANISM="Leptocylindrus danicus var. danicus, Strain B650" /LENGTH=241 /DNA_ID=CAMNT_0003471787 /DNA_START=396 /DNA_END=1121 /DNA_ORIENTATION=+